MPTRSTARARLPRSPASRSAPLERSKRKSGTAAAKRRSKKRKRAAKADCSIREDNEAREAESGNLIRTTEEEDEDEVSSACSSPIRRPLIPDEMYLIDDLDTDLAIRREQDKYSQKLARQRKNLPTLIHHMCRPSTCLLADPELLPVRESARKTVLSVAKSVLGLSSSVGGEPLARCFGFWIDWDEKNKTGIVLTTAHLIRTKAPLDDWLGKEEYAPDAEVFVHLGDDTTLKAYLHYYQKHHNLAFFRVRMDQTVPLLPFTDGVKCAQRVFELGRDEKTFLTIRHGLVQDLKPNLLERYHYMYVHGAGENPKHGNGGPIIDFDGKVVGIVNESTRGSFVPSSILLACLHLWRKFQCIPRPHLGLKFTAIKLLDPPYAEKILCKCNIQDGLIVEEVSDGSPAEKLGIRVGDVIGSFNGECISTTVELENMLLSRCEDGRNGLNSKVNVELWIFHARRRLWRSKILTANVSDDGEVVVRGAYYPFGEGNSASVLLDLVD